MNTEFLTTIAKVGGLAGLTLGTVLLLIQTLAKVGVFPKLKRDDAYRIMNRGILAMWSIGMVGALAWLFGGQDEPGTHSLEPPKAVSERVAEMPAEELEKLSPAAGIEGVANDSQELPLKYSLEIDGQQHEVVLDKPILIQGTYNDPKVLLRVSPIRQFAYGDIAFQYPAHYIWEAEVEASNEKTWTLSGNDFTIMYFILPDALSVREYAQNLAKRFGEGSTRISETEITLGGHRYRGKLLFVKLVGTTLSTEVYALPARTGSRLFVLQDSPPDNRAISKEGEKTFALLSKSFRDTSTNKPDAGDGK